MDGCPKPLWTDDGTKDLEEYVHNNLKKKCTTKARNENVNSDYFLGSGMTYNFLFLMPLYFSHFI